MKLSYPILLVCILPLVANSCNGFPAFNSPQTPVPPVPTATLPPLQAVVTFKVQIPVPTHEGLQVYLDILDEVTGLALNPIRYKMESIDDQFYTITIPQILGSVIKYRYSRGDDASEIEYTASGNQVRYRLFYVTGPGEVFDMVSAWNDQVYQGQTTGRISGRITDSTTNSPIPGVMVAAGGYQTFTINDGTFLIDGLPQGVHNLTAYSVDGAYHTYQQGATIESDTATPTPISLIPAPLVKITFHVTAPKEVTGVPIRFSGNLINLGNTFSDLAGGVSGVASRMPILLPEADGTYTITLDAHAGTDLRYKYTLGDGFWNSEQAPDGTMVVRQLIVPESDTTVEDTIATWISGTITPFVFDVQAPANTPSSDFVSIQFNPFGWTEPIPMWSMGNNRWYYILYNPLGMMSSLHYRYCRNDQCGSADDSATIGSNPEGWNIDFKNVPQTFQDNISSWNWWGVSTTPTTVSSVEVKPRSSSFLAGVEFLPDYQPTWQAHYLSLFQNLNQTGSNWVIISPAWTYKPGNLPILAPVAGSNPFWQDSEETILQAQSQNLKVAIFPQPDFPVPPETWWATSQRDFAWWQVWFEQYRRFILHHAELASQSGASALIIGGDWITPTLTYSKLAGSSTPSGVPGDAESRWRQIISDIRSVYKGSIIWAQSYPDITKDPPPFLDAVDQLYILISNPIANSSNPNQEELTNAISQFMEKDIHPLAQKVNKSVILGIEYPSAEGSASACIPAEDQKCLQFQALNRPNPDIPSVKLNLQEQADIYNAYLTVLNQNDWINGFISRGFYPPVALQDKSVSIHGKPAFDVLSYWFPKFVNGQ